MVVALMRWVIILIVGVWSLEIGKALPQVNLESLEGKEESLVFSKKYIIVDFWGSWCIPCRKSLPHLEQEFNKQRDILFTSVSVDNQKEKAISFYNKLSLSHKAYWDSQKTMIEILNPTGFPALYVFDGTGILLWQKSGYTIADVETLKRKFKAGEL